MRQLCLILGPSLLIEIWKKYWTLFRRLPVIGHWDRSRCGKRGTSFTINNATHGIGCHFPFFLFYFFSLIFTSSCLTALNYYLSIIFLNVNDQKGTTLSFIDILFLFDSLTSLISNFTLFFLVLLSSCFLPSNWQKNKTMGLVITRHPLLRHRFEAPVI